MPKKINREKPKIQCQGTSCGHRLLVRNAYNFYKSNNPIHNNEMCGGYAPICKGCLKELCMGSDNQININGLMYVLKFLNKPFIKDVYLKLLNSEGGFDLGTYLKDISFNAYTELRFSDSDDYKEENVPLNINNKDIDNTNIFTRKDEKVKSEVVELIGYDLFCQYSKADQKFLYNELLPYLNEETLEDSYLLSQIIQIVDNNSQIRNINIQKNKLITDGILKNAEELKKLTNIVKAISETTDKLAKENGISVKNRSDKKTGESELTSKMKEYREKGFENAEQDYYDQNKAYGMKVCADISNKSILEQLQFDENDVNEMFFSQRKRIKELQDKVMDLEEENRQLHVKMQVLRN
ncbi:hypothetical protein ACFHWD_04010 [Clostridium sp. MT-14]|uniref:hypothetical protein n=1 Tax=Clostridium sp. MT-14 TaxID=3348360 RepID=UPI0035F2548A